MTIGFIAHEGHMLSAEHLRIAQVIHDYDERLELAYIPPEARSEREEFPYAVIFNNPNGNRELVMKLRENEVDHRVIARLWAADNQNGNVLDRIEAEEDARKALEMLQREDEAAERAELAAWMIKAPVGAKHNGVVLQ